MHATLWNNGTVTDLGTLGGTSSYANGINDSGQVVGISNIHSNMETHATLWSNGTVTDLGTLGGIGSAAFGINASGQIVGYAYTSGNGPPHATLWSNGTVTDLNSLLNASTVSAGWVLNEAHAINNSGFIAGIASNSILGIDSHAFLLSNVAAVPESDPLPMMLMGLGLLGFVARRRKNQQA